MSNQDDYTKNKYTVNFALKSITPDWDAVVDRVKANDTVTMINFQCYQILINSYRSGFDPMKEKLGDYWFGRIQDEGIRQFIYELTNLPALVNKFDDIYREYHEIPIMLIEDEKTNEVPIFSKEPVAEHLEAARKYIESFR